MDKPADKAPSVLLLVAGAKGAIGTTLAAAVAAMQETPQLVVSGLTTADKFTFLGPCHSLAMAGWDPSPEAITDALDQNGVLPEGMWRPHIAHLEQITGKIGQGQGALGSLVASRELVDGVLSNLDKMNVLLDDMQATAARGPVLMDQVGDNLSTIQAAGTGIVDNVYTLNAILEEARVSIETIQVILENLKQGSQEIPQVTQSARQGIREIREGVENIDRVVQSLQRNIIIRSNLPDEPLSMDIDAGIRPD